MLDELMELIEYETKGVIAVLLIAIVFSAGASWCWNEYWAGYNARHAPVEIPTVTITPTPAISQVTPAPTPDQTWASQAYIEKLSGAPAGTPGGFERNIITDPIGVYHSNIGTCPVYYIDVETWMTYGGIIVVQDRGDLPGHHVYTRFGLDSQVRYDPDKNIAYSIIPDPWQMELDQERRGII